VLFSQLFQKLPSLSFLICKSTAQLFSHLGKLLFGFDCEAKRGRSKNNLPSSRTLVNRKTNKILFETQIFKKLLFIKAFGIIDL
jgi:hypothetical protein